MAKKRRMAWLSRSVVVLFLEARTYVPPVPEKKAWYVSLWDWTKSLFGRKERNANA